MRFRFALGSLAVTAVIVAACSSFSSNDPTPAPGDDAATTPDVQAPADDAGQAADANPCALGNGKHTNSFCDDFDRTTGLGDYWINIVKSSPEAGIGIALSDAAASPPNVMVSFFPNHGFGTGGGAIAEIPVSGVSKIDCRFSVLPVAVDSQERVILAYVEVQDVAPSTRNLVLLYEGSNQQATVFEAYHADGVNERDASTTLTPVQLGAGWRRVHIVAEKGQPLRLDLDNLYSYTGSVPSDVKLTRIGLGASSVVDGGAGAAVAYDDVVCTYE